MWLAGRRVRQLSLTVIPGKTFELAIDVRAEGETRLEPRLLFEDAALLVLDKPPGLPSQGTLATDQATALGWGQRLAGPEVRTVHRLDIGTSGVLLLAKTAAAATSLAAQFREGHVRKRYLALCLGKLADSGELRGWLRPAPRPGSFEIGEARGVPAETNYRVLRRAGPLVLVEARPLTGRTHQIRVHLASAGAPLLGDVRYGGRTSIAHGATALAVVRPLLHAAEICFLHPASGAEMTFAAAPPGDFLAVAALLDAHLPLP